jgi:hypothetical protein
MRVFGERVLRIICIEDSSGKTRKKEPTRESQIQVGG